jgi:tetratricopeptide (TPR) repeat protein
MNRRSGSLVCLLAAVLIASILGLQSGSYQDWRLAHESVQELQSELRAQGESPRLLYYIGMKLNGAHRFAAADGYLRQAVGLDPESPRLRDEWARALLGSGQTTAAFGELRQYAGVYPNLAQAHYLLGKFYYTERSMSRASEELERAIGLDPGHVDALLYLAAARDSLHYLEGARQAAARAAQLQPNDTRTHLVLASLLVRTNGPSRQIRFEFESAIALSPKNAAAHQEFARWLLDASTSADDRELADKHARRAIELGVNDAASYLVRGRACIYRGDGRGAVENLTRAAQLAPGDPAAALALSQVYFAMKEPALSDLWRNSYLQRLRFKAKRDSLLQDVILGAPDPERKAALARWLGRHGDAEGCVRNCSMALRMPLDSAPVMIAASRALIDGGYGEQALPLCLRAVEGARRNPDAHEVLGDALLNLRQVGGAADSYNEAIRLDPDRGAALMRRLRRFIAGHNREPAIRSLTIVVRKTPPAPQVVATQNYQ